MLDTLKVSQFTVDEMIDDLAGQIRRSAKIYSSIVGIASGGIHISKPLSAKLGIPHHSIRINHYDGCHLKTKPFVCGFLPQPTGNLIVDDLIDGGWTMRTFERYFGLDGSATAVLYWKVGSFKPNFYVAEKPSAWILFPWSKDE